MKRITPMILVLILLGSTGDTANAQASKKKVDQAAPTGLKVPVGEWPQHRGPNRDNISQETGLLKKWPEGGPKQIRKIEGLGEGYSSVAVANGTIFTLGTKSGDEVLHAYDAETGDSKWSTRMGELFTEGQGNGPRSTPTVVDGNVYALGAKGDLVCVDEKSGSLVWHKNILSEFGGSNIVWGISESPLIDGDKLICTPGGSTASMVALNRKDGKVIWSAKVPGAPKAGYSSPIICDIAGIRQYVTVTHDGVMGIRASNGEALWGNKDAANGTANCSTPLVWNTSIFYASGYGTGGALVRIATTGKAQKATTAYKTQDMKNHHGGMVLLNGFIYGFDEAVMKCLDVRTGKVAWQNRSVGKGSLVCADNQLFLRSENGPLALIEVNAKEYVENGRFDQPERSGRPAWSHPVVAGGRLYLRDQDKLLVYDVKSP